VLSADRLKDAAATGSAISAAPPLASDAKLLPLTAAPRGATEPGQQTVGVTWAGDVSPALGNGETRSAPVMVHIFQGGSESKEFHF
jgi:hypothetical protein